MSENTNVAETTDSRVTVPEGKPVTPSDKAMKELRKVTDPKSPQGLAALSAVGKFIVPPSKTDAQGKEIDSLTEHLADVKAQRDHAVAYRLDAIRTALSKKFTGKAIAAEYHVSGPYVTYVKQGLDLQHTAKEAGGSINLRDAVAATSNAARNYGTVDALVAAVSEAGGVLPEKRAAADKKAAAAPRRVKVSRLLKAAQDIATLSRVTDWTGDDVASLKEAHANLSKALRNVDTMVEKATAAKKTQDTASAASAVKSAQTNGARGVPSGSTNAA